MIIIIDVLQSQIIMIDVKNIKKLISHRVRQGKAKRRER